MMILDWWHLRQKCAELGSRICHGHLAKEHFLLQLQRRLWRGDVDAACAYLETYRPQARNTEKLEELLAYLRARQEFLPNYRQRYISRQYSGSGHTEKLNDLLIARRQKGAGRHWSQETSDALAALRTLLLKRRVDAVLATPPGPPLARLLTRTLCVLTKPAPGAEPTANMPPCPGRLVHPRTGVLRDQRLESGRMTEAARTRALSGQSPERGQTQRPRAMSGCAASWAKSPGRLSAPKAPALGHSSNGWLAARARPKGLFRNNLVVYSSARAERVIPLAMEGVALDPQGLHLGVGHHDAGGIGGAV